jgi:hypothetical protein
MRWIAAPETSVGLLYTRAANRHKKNQNDMDYLF